MVDVFHTPSSVVGIAIDCSILFYVWTEGPAGLLLLEYLGLEDPHPVFCMPASLIDYTGINDES